MKKIILTLTALSVLLLASCSKADKNGWYDDLDAAKKACGKRNILLVVNSFMDYDGSEKGIEVLTGTPDFAKAVKDSYVCVHYDMSDAAEVFGEPVENITEKEQKAKDKAKAEFMKKGFVLDCIGIQETPAAAILTKEGYFVTEPEFDFTGDNIDSYISNLKLEDETVADANATVALTNKGSAVEKVEAIDTLYESMTESQRLLMTDLCKKVLSLDKKNESGKVGKYVTAVAHAEAYDCFMKHDGKGAVKAYRTSAKDSRLTPEEAQSLYMIIVSLMLNDNQGNIEDVKAVLQEGLDAGPDTQYAPLFKNALENLSAEKPAQEKESE